MWNLIYKIAVKLLSRESLKFGQRETLLLKNINQ